jgi:hypothetical protein
MENDIFDWGQLPSDWWLQTAKEIGADERHAKFAAAKHRGCSNTEAARLSGYGTGGAESTRSEGYRVSRSNKVTQLLALAAAEAGGGYDGSLTRQEAKHILTAMARGSDPQVRIKSIELLGKIDEQSGSATNRPRKRITRRSFIYSAPHYPNRGLGRSLGYRTTFKARATSSVFHTSEKLPRLPRSASPMIGDGGAPNITRMKLPVWTNWRRERC